MKTILVPVNFSRATPRVVACAMALARASGARMVLLNVTLPARILSDHAKLERLVERVFKRQASPTGQTGGVSGDALELVGKPAAVILEQANRLQAEYIVMGSRDSASSRKAIGAKAAHVVREARCPVVLVPAPKRGSRGAVPARVWRSVRAETPNTRVADA